MMSFGCFRLFIVAAIFAAACPGFCGETGAVLYTSTRSVTGFAIAGDGSLWAATRGGVLHRENGSWRKFTEADGLASSEALGIAAEGESVRVIFGGKSAVMRDGKWMVEPFQFKPKQAMCSVIWKNAAVEARLTDVRINSGGSWRSIGFPKSTGSHISAMLSKGEKLWAAMFGDGLWQFDGKAWSPVKIGLPSAAKEITAMAEIGKRLVIGTRREGIWEYDAKSWHQIFQPNEPYNANIQNAINYKGMIFFSTLEDGIVVKGADGWKHFHSPEISSDAPRQMVEFGGALYVRHGSGKVDRFNGKSWERNVFAALPRKQVSVLAADDKRIYLAQWGGWSEFDGKTWEHHLKVKELQGFPITALLPDSNTIWVGTQGRGLAEVARLNEKVKWHDERNGLPDDWVKRIAKCGDSVCAGTFTGGLARLEGSSWISAKELGQGEITDLIAEQDGSVLAATRKGVWRISGDGRIAKIASIAPEIDAQALALNENGIWIGARTGIWFTSTHSPL
ncbi:MAG: hypothetical protein NT018_07340 [Armatimonadetes bacterium]|nr:hypothetical protein [Armatimonadota bacterium]